MKIVKDELEITEMSLSDVMAICEFSQDEDNRRFLPDEVFETYEQALESVTKIIANYDTGEGPQVFSLRAKNKHIGHVELVKIERGYEVGYFVSKENRNKGYATKALQIFLEYLAQNTTLEEVYGICDEINFASQKVLDKCRFTLDVGNVIPNKKVYIYKFSRL